jgi:hypothetical protein
MPMPAAHAAGYFQSGATYTLPSDFAFGLAVGDFNGDGEKDIAALNFSSCCPPNNGVNILLGKGDGTFEPGTTYAAGYGEEDVVTADLNGDGKTDLAVTALYDAKVNVLLGNGDGTFRTGGSYAAGGPLGIAAGDFNGDGRPDLAVTDYNDGAVTVLLNNGGSFVPAPGSPYRTGSHAYDVAVADLNRDGKLDLAVTNVTADTVSILLGNGDGTFQTASTYSVPGNPAGLAVEDFNNDGLPDLVTANSAATTVSVLMNRAGAPGSFQDPVSYGAGGAPYDVVVDDVNHDGKPDLVVSDDTDNGISLLLGDGAGRFTLDSTYETGTRPRHLATGDFNGDGTLDLAVANSASDTIRIVLGVGHSSPPTPTSTPIPTPTRTPASTPIPTRTPPPVPRSKPVSFTIDRLQTLNASHRKQSSFKVGIPFTLELDWTVRHLKGTSKATLKFSYQLSNAGRWKTVQTIREQIITVNGPNLYTKESQLNAPGRFRIVIALTISSHTKRAAVQVQIRR